jgi:hypothetical protein
VIRADCNTLTGTPKIALEAPVSGNDALDNHLTGTPKIAFEGTGSEASEMIISGLDR